MKKGVFITYKKDGTPYYRSSFTFQNKHISLGSFSSEEQAGLAYEEALLLCTDESLTLTSGKSSRPLLCKMGKYSEFPG